MRTSETTRRSLSVLSCLCFVPALALFSVAASAEGAGFDFAGMKLPPGFTATTYISGAGFDPNQSQSAPGLPAIVTITFDSRGNLYFARTANRLREIYGSDSAPIYRLPVGPARITPDMEGQFLFGPPLSDPDEAACSNPPDTRAARRDATFRSTPLRNQPVGADSQRCVLPCGSPAARTQSGGAVRDLHARDTCPSTGQNGSANTPLKECVHR